MSVTADSGLSNDLAPALAEWSSALRRAIQSLHLCGWDSDVEKAMEALPELPPEATTRDRGAALARALAPFNLRTRVIGDFSDGMMLPGVVLLGRVGDWWYALQVPGYGGAAELLGPDGEPSGVPLPEMLALAEGETLLLAPIGVPNVSADAVPKYMPMLRLWWRRYSEIALAGAAINLLALVSPVFTMLVYDKIVGNGITETLWALAFGVLLAAALDFVLRIVRAWYVEQIAYGSDQTLDRSMLDRLLAHREANAPPVGPVLNKYKELVAAREFITSNYVLNAADLPFMVVFIAALWLVAGPLVFVPLLCAGAMVTIHAVLSIPAKDYAALARRAVSRKIALLVEILSASELLKTSRLRVPTGRRWRALAEDAALASARGRFWSAVSTSSTNFWMMVGTASVMVAGVYRIEGQELTTGGLVACSMLASRAMSSAASVAFLFSRYQDFRRASAELDAIVTEPPANEVASSAPRRIEGRLTVRNMSYRFSPEASWAIENVNIAIEPGERVALLGRPGSGKTTLLRCLAGIVAPSSGMVLLDGVSVRQHHPLSRARWVSYKPQEPMMFEGSLDENIRAGVDETGTDTLQTALNISGLAEAIQAGELSLDMRLESRGTNLSGGQRQSVALARALVGNPSLLLLDEPTAGLDQAGEMAVAGRLRAFAEGRTLVVATHSPHLIAMVDRLIVVDRGHIVADGPKERILRKPPQAA